jgi:hypothetical protein
MNRTTGFSVTVWEMKAWTGEVSTDASVKAVPSEVRLFS